METEPGDDYVRRYAGIIRAHEQRLANAGLTKGSGGAVGYLNPLTWVDWSSVGSTPTPRRGPPTMLQLDLHHLYYLLIRFEGLGLRVGSLDIKLLSTSRPVSYASLLAAKDRSDTLSLSSFTSAFSAMSKLSLGGSWFTRAEPPMDLEVKYIYSAFTKLPALSLKKSDLRVIAELADDPPIDNAVPMYSFKNLQTLETLDVDPRMLLGWDQLSESLRSLTVKRSGLEDVTDLLIDCILDDQARRENSRASSRSSSPRRPRPSRFASGRFSRRQSIAVPTIVKEDLEPEEVADTETDEPLSIPLLSRHKWRFLRHLSLADNALTFFPSTPLTSLTSLTHLDLSSNLLVSVPPGLSALYNLVSLNLADNMIDSVLGIYAHLGQILTINLEGNRLESICGLERLLALERVDLRGNQIQDPGEIGRLAVLPNIAEVWVENNPMTALDDQYRVHCFELFAQENKTLVLDGNPPSFLEARSMRVAPPDLTKDQKDLDSRRRSVASPPVVAVSSSSSPSSLQAQRSPRSQSQQRQASGLANGIPFRPDTPPSDPHAGLTSPSSVLSAGSKPAKKRKPKRLVDLDGANTDGSHSDTSTAHNPSDNSPLGLQPQRTSRHRRGMSESETHSQGSRLLSPPRSMNGAGSSTTPTGVGESTAGKVVSVQRKTGKKSRHGRYATEGHTGAEEDVGQRLRSAADVDDPHRPDTVLEAGEEDGNGLSEADAYRAKIDALRREVGDSWLKVLSQSGGLPPGVPSGGS